MSSLHNDLDTWSAHANARGKDQIVISTETARNIAEALRAGGELNYAQMLEYERRILDREVAVEKLKRLIVEPSENGSYVGDTYYPVGGTLASHRWNGTAWEWLPEFAQDKE